MTGTTEKSSETDKDKRLQVLIYLALFICLVHLFQENSRNKTEEQNQDNFVWITTPFAEGLYLLPKEGLKIKELFANLKSGDQISQAYGENLRFKSEPRKSYRVHQNNPQELQESYDHPKAAPFFYKKILINEAEMKILTTIPGVGETLAKKIIMLRSERGSITSLEELMLVDGIGKKKLEIITKYLAL